MPMYEYFCTVCSEKFTNFYKTFSEAEEGESCGLCPKCGMVAPRIVSLPLAPHLLGSPEGYHKPSPTKRHSHKLASEKDGNKYSNG